MDVSEMSWKHLKDVPQELLDPEAALLDLEQRFALHLSVLKEKMSLVQAEVARVKELEREVEKKRRRAEEVRRLSAEEEAAVEARRKTCEELRLRSEAAEEEDEEDAGGLEMSLYDHLERLKKETIRAERSKAEKKEKLLKYRDVLVGKAWYFKRYLGVHVSLDAARGFVLRFGGPESEEAVVLGSDGFKEWRVVEMAGVSPEDLEKKAFDLEETDNLLALLAAARKQLSRAADRRIQG